MPNISTSNTNSIYKYTAQIITAFENDEDPLTIDFLRFKSIIIDYYYEGFNFPLIYCNVNLQLEAQQKLAANQKNGTVVFTLQKYMENSDTPGLVMDVVNEECIFFIPQDVGKTNEKTAIADPNKTDDLGDNITIGLIAVDHINMIKNTTNATVKKSSMSALLCYLLNKQDLLIEPLENNTVIENFVLPPLNSLSKQIQYLNNYSTFYNTQYRFFIDFGITYLLSSSGQGVRCKGEESNIIKFTLHNSYDERNMEGMSYELENNMYQIDCSGSFSTMSDISDTSKSFSSIGGITTDGRIDVESTGLRDEESPIIAKVNNIRIPNNNTSLINNIVTNAANSAVLLNIIKNKIDGSIVTPNKQIYVDTESVYGEKYSGLYILSRKRELYVREGEGLAMSLVVSLKRLANQ